eukprot:768310-Hanusia_phi.AAC.3
MFHPSFELSELPMSAGVKVSTESEAWMVDVIEGSCIVQGHNPHPNYPTKRGVYNPSKPSNESQSGARQDRDRREGGGDRRGEEGGGEERVARRGGEQMRGEARRSEERRGEERREERRLERREGREEWEERGRQGDMTSFDSASISGSLSPPVTHSWQMPLPVL